MFECAGNHQQKHRCTYVERRKATTVERPFWPIEFYEMGGFRNCLLVGLATEEDILYEVNKNRPKTIPLFNAARSARYSSTAVARKRREGEATCFVGKTKKEKGQGWKKGRQPTDL